MVGQTNPLCNSYQHQNYTEDQDDSVGLLRISSSRDTVRTKSFQRIALCASIIILGVIGMTTYLNSRSKQTQISIFQTTKDTDLRMTKLDSKSHGIFTPQSAVGADNLDLQGGASGVATINLLFDQRFQRIRGFGGAFTEASAYNFFQLPAAVQDKFLEAYFGESGLKYNIGRIHINSCDFSLGSYNFDDVSGDFDLEHFDETVAHDLEYLIPFIKRAQMVAANPIEFFASPWSPPEWMKVPFDETVPEVVNGTTKYIKKIGIQSMVGSAQDFGLINSTEIQTAWAKYVSKWLTAYKQHGIDFWGITVQNEPEFAAPWESCTYKADYMAEYVKNALGPIMRAEHPEIKIMGFDHNKDHIYTWAETLFNDPEVSQYMDGLAFHWYGGGLDRLIDGTYGYYNLLRVANAFPDKFLMPSEGCSCPGVEIGSWLRAERKAHDIIQDLNNYAEGWTDWNLLLDHTGGPNHVGNNCDAPILCNEDKSDIMFQPEYYYQGHIMKYLAPGAQRVYSDVKGQYQNKGGDSGAFLGMDVTLYNCEQSSRQFWYFAENGKIGLYDTMSWEYPQCFGGPKSFGNEALKLTNCFFGGGGHPYNWGGAQFKIDEMDRLLLVNGSYWNVEGYNEEKLYCLSILANSDVDGAAVTLQECADLGMDGSPPLVQRWTVDPDSGSIASKLNGKCMTAGWGMFQGGAFINPDGSKVVVVLNEATEDVTFNMVDATSVLTTSIPAKSIQTYVF